MSRFDLSKMGQKIEENKVELGKSYLNEASLSMRDTRKKTEYISLDEIVPNPDNKLSMPNVKWLIHRFKSGLRLLRDPERLMFFGILFCKRRAAQLSCHL